MNWYISLAMRWMDLDGSDVVAFHQFCDDEALPDHQERMPFDSRHCTLFAFAKFEEGVGPYKDPERGARLLFEQFKSARFPTLLNDLKRFSIRPTYRNDNRDSSTTVQFEALQPGRLETLREQTQKSFEIFLTQNLWGLVNGFTCEYPFWDDQKNQGSLLWGSLGRPSGPVEDVTEEKTPLTKFARSEFEVSKLILTVSNDSLTNSLTRGDNYVEIPLGK